MVATSGGAAINFAEKLLLRMKPKRKSNSAQTEEATKTKVV